MSESLHIDIIVLAAGASTRLGTPKQLLRIHGNTFLRWTVEQALHSNAKSVHVVIGYEAEKIKPEISDLPVEVLINENWERGISTSICTGIQSVQPDVDAAIIVLCDQPALSADILNTLIYTYASTRAPIVACRYAGTVGVPALYDRSVFSELLELRGDHGAKTIIERYASERKEIDFSGGEIDIDTMADQEKIK